jgi:hypothetical protein
MGVRLADMEELEGNEVKNAGNDRVIATEQTLFD